MYVYVCGKVFVWWESTCEWVVVGRKCVCVCTFVFVSVCEGRRERGQLPLQIMLVSIYSMFIN